MLSGVADSLTLRLSFALALLKTTRLFSLLLLKLTRLLLSFLIAFFSFAVKPVYFLLASVISLLRFITLISDL